jgi:hypothetical protein
MFLSNPRSFCRNPLCKQQLPELVETDQQAFCRRGCRESFYRHRCLVCEKSLAHEKQKTCSRRCRAEYRRSPHRFQQAKRPVSSSVNLKREVPYSSGFLVRATGAARGVATTVNLIQEVPIPRASKWHPAATDWNPLAAANCSNAAIVKAAGATAIFQRNVPPLNLIGGYRFKGAPAVELVLGRATTAEQSIPDLSLANSDPFEIPPFLRSAP